ncbi:MAG: ATP phosphoribosyltransferase [Lactobacillaceae bacterium]|nr:ATP phosphoribosyltransferase [Lactobacillaceae bacterium]
MNEKILAAGSRDEFGTRLLQKQKISQKISEILNAAEFTPISTPLIERASTFERMEADDVFHLYDEVGDNLVLRPDLTLPIARFLAVNRQQRNFEKLYYIGDVFRRTAYLSGAYNQETQAGIELIGDASFQAEITALDTMLTFAAAFEIENVQVVLSDARFIDAVLASLDIGLELQRALKTAIQQKNISEFERVRRLIPDFPPLLAKWPLAFGEPGEALMWQLRDLPVVHDIVAGWLKLAEYTHNKYPNVAVTIDLAATSPQPYYTGTIIRGFVPSLGQYLFSGGRYDYLLENFKQEALPAVGMGLDIETILAAWQPVPTENEHQPIVMVLAKGRVEADARPLLQAAGIDTSELEHPARKLIFDSQDGKYRFILVKPSDVVKYLDRGIGDVGIVGSDTIAEEIQAHYDVLDLQTGLAEFVVAAPVGADFNAPHRKRIATKYPKVTTEYFSGLGEDVELIKLDGSVELAPLTGLADAIVDITQTGNTLRENQLEIIEHVRPVATHLLVRSGALLQFQVELSRVISNLNNILQQQSEDTL